MEEQFFKYKTLLTTIYPFITDKYIVNFIFSELIHSHDLYDEEIYCANEYDKKNKKVEKILVIKQLIFYLIDSLENFTDITDFEIEIYIPKLTRAFINEILNSLEDKRLFISSDEKLNEELFKLYTKKMTNFLQTQTFNEVKINGDIIFKKFIIEKDTRNLIEKNLGEITDVLPSVLNDDDKLNFYLRLFKFTKNRKIDFIFTPYIKSSSPLDGFFTLNGIGKFYCARTKQKWVNQPVDEKAIEKLYELGLFVMILPVNKISTISQYDISYFSNDGHFIKFLYDSINSSSKYSKEKEEKAETLDIMNSYLSKIEFKGSDVENIPISDKKIYEPKTQQVQLEDFDEEHNKILLPKSFTKIPKHYMILGSNFGQDKNGNNYYGIMAKKDRFLNEKIVSSLYIKNHENIIIFDTIKDIPNFQFFSSILMETYKNFENFYTTIKHEILNYIDEEYGKDLIFDETIPFFNTPDFRVYNITDPREQLIASAFSIENIINTAMTGNSAFFVNARRNFPQKISGKKTKTGTIIIAKRIISMFENIIYHNFNGKDDDDACEYLSIIEKDAKHIKQFDVLHKSIFNFNNGPLSKIGFTNLDLQNVQHKEKIFNFREISERYDFYNYLFKRIFKQKISMKEVL